MDLLRKRFLLALGGLFHDVGKLVERAGGKSEDKEEFGYAHAELSYKFIEEVFKDKLKMEDYEVILAGAFHHKPKDEYGSLFQIADRSSSKERSEREEELQRRELKRLRPVFLGISLKGFAEQTDRNYYIEIKPLELGEDVLFPKEGEPREGTENYKNLYDGLKGELKQLDFSNIQKAFLRAYHLFYKYCWCVPASTYDRDKSTKHYPDISLFDHSRVVSAIACALATDYNEKNNNKKFILVDGDISGIQEFLFSLTNIKGVAKRLRGRSFFLSMLPQLVARALLWKFNYPLCNLIYAGGGKFLALLGYEDGIEEGLKEFAKEIEESLLRAFGGKLGFVLSWVYADIEGLTGKGFKNTMKDLHEQISLQKKRKFSLTMENFEKLVGDKRGAGICPSCQWEMLKEGQEVCYWCETFFQLGFDLLDAKYVAFDKNEFKNVPGFYIDGIGGVYLLSESWQGFEEVYLINDTNFLKNKADGFIFFAKYVPKTEVKTVDFEELAERAEGDKKVAFARGDVDFLGLIFQSLEEYSLSRLATLSRSLDLFFSGYLNTFLDGSNIYTLYAGGDDFFLVGPWDELVEKLQDLKKAFDRYSAYNPAINFSVGVHIDRPEVPIRFVGEYAEKEEKRVKKEKTKQILEEKKDGLFHFSILGELLTQEGLEESIRSSESLKNLIEKRKIGRSTFYRIYMLMKNYREYEKNNKKWWKFYPLFYYQVYRNMDSEYQKDFVNALIDSSDDYTLKDNALFLAKYVIMKTRSVSESSEKES